jgi:hypothetical protein
MSRTNHSDSIKQLSKADIIQILEVLIDNIFIIFDEGVFQQTDRRGRLHKGNYQGKRKETSPII